VRNEDDLVRFVQAVGCCTIGELPRYPQFPSVAVAMEIPEPIGHIWFWKDDLHVQRRLYYTRLFGGRPGFISLDLLPACVAANGVAADELFLLGQAPAETQEIYTRIDEDGPISTRKLKQSLSASACKASTTALIDLERRFIITKTAITGRERGTYGYVWDLAERWVPDAFTAADRLRRAGGREALTRRLQVLGVPLDARFLTRVMRWE
jgi:hypothetical protein